jgi:hypothetical protein
MKDLLRGILKAYAAAAAYVVAVFFLITAVLFLTGAITGERLDAAFQALRGRRPETFVVAEKKPADGLAEREEILEKRTQEVQKLEERTVARLSLIRAEQDTLERKRTESDAAAAEAKRAQREFAAVKSDAELDANLPILTRMEAPGIVAVRKDGDDARFVRHLRAMRPSKAAEVLEALRVDPQFEQEFRKVPGDAPPGTKPRMQRLNEEFQKTP